LRYLGVGTINVISDTINFMSTVANGVGAHWRVRKYMHTLDRLALVVSTERKSLGYSLSEVAAAAGVPLSSVVALEIDPGNSHLVDVRRILQVLGIKPLALPGELLVVQK
jgi:hypothetical protein